MILIIHTDGNDGKYASRMIWVTQGNSQNDHRAHHADRSIDKKRLASDTIDQKDRDEGRDEIGRGVDTRKKEGLLQSKNRSQLVYRESITPTIFYLVVLATFGLLTMKCDSPICKKSTLM
jgi:hypothetical protein